MSYTFTLSGRSSTLSTRIYPPIILDKSDVYVLGLIDFVSYNAIPNVDSSNNIFHYDDREVEIPEGSYEVNDLEKYINNSLIEKKKEVDKTVLILRANNNTLKCEIKCNKTIDFSKKNSIGPLLGFKPRILEADTRHTSDFPIAIFKVNSICVECNLVTNSFNNENPVHILHMFYPSVPPGYKIIENPTNVIYLPIKTQYIDEIVLKISDQDGNLVNFKRELITVRLHLKKIV